VVVVGPVVVVVGPVVVVVGPVVVVVGPVVVVVGPAVVVVGPAVVVGAVPLPLVRTTTDSAGTVTALPETLLVTMLGSASSYVYSVSEALVIPRLEVLTLYELVGSALTSMTAYDPPERSE
jgi:hypothetical protein